MEVSISVKMVAIVLAFFPALFGPSLGKECTNTPTQLSSHTFRHEVLTSDNKTLKEQMFSHYHLTPTDDSTWANLLPRKVLREEDELEWMMMYRNIKHRGMSELEAGFLKEVPLSDVRLDPDSAFGQAQQTNLEYLLLLEVDRLVYSFRRTAGLPTVGEGYRGWEDPNTELRGHFVGHYLSASALMWASTNNNTLKERMTVVVDILASCQEKIGSGYLSAFPSTFFDRFEDIQPVWAPYYTIHKILAGLVDQYVIVGNHKALKMASWMADYFYNRVQNVIRTYSIERHWLSLNEETGGMNDVLYRLYRITGDTKQLLLAQLFDKPCFLGVLALKADDISGFHVNTHIPIVIGSQMRYEVTGDPLYKEIGKFFMDIVNSSHSFPTGGTSVSEFWLDPKRLAKDLTTETEESCTTYNMLKVSRNLFRWTKEIAYADYYERAINNGVLSIQRGKQPGKMIYMLPMGRGMSKAVSYHGWGTRFHSFWCCYGTGIESFSKLGDSIYFEERGQEPGLYVIQYVSSSLNWKSGRILLRQKVEPVVSWDPRLRVTLTISSEEGSGVESTLNLRIPSWTTSNGIKAALNSQDLTSLPPGNYLSVKRKWSSGDVIYLELPLTLRTEAIKDDRPEYSAIQSILYGPYLLVGLTENEWNLKPDSTTLSDWIIPVPPEYNSHLISLSQNFGNSSFALAHSKFSIAMTTLPETGTNTSVHATFRLVLPDLADSKIQSSEMAIGRTVKLEPFDYPGMVISSKGTHVALGNADASDDGSSTFRMVSGLDGKPGSVSLELESQKGCYLYSNLKSAENVRLGCDGGRLGKGFKKAASFVLSEGISKYHPMSFVAKGLSRNFLLEPLNSLQDENYTVFFSFNG